MSKKLKGASPTPKKTRAAKTTPTHEEIALRAYEIYLARGREDGHDVDDWLQAERELIGGVVDGMLVELEQAKHHSEDR